VSVQTQGRASLAQVWGDTSGTPEGTHRLTTGDHRLYYCLSLPRPFFSFPLVVTTVDPPLSVSLGRVNCQPPVRPHVRSKGKSKGKGLREKLSQPRSPLVSSSYTRGKRMYLRQQFLGSIECTPLHGLSWSPPPRDSGLIPRVNQWDTPWDTPWETPWDNQGDLLYASRIDLFCEVRSVVGFDLQTLPCPLPVGTSPYSAFPASEHPPIPPPKQRVWAMGYTPIIPGLSLTPVFGYVPSG
jgi:hypothetical protein